ncbi:MAG: phage baseplate assembly protein V [Pseudomonadota bacterium]
MNLNGFDLAEQDRRGRVGIQVGDVIETDYPNARIKVQLGDLPSTWLPWMITRAGGDRTWWAPEIGEQVVVAAPGGELDQAIVLGSLYQADHPAPANSPDIHRTEYSDGSFVEMNRGTGKLTISTTGDVEIIAGGNLQLRGQRIDLN